MITLTKPDTSALGTIGYWSVAVEALIRNEGLISVSTEPIEGSTELVLPGAHRQLDGSAVYELDGSVPKELGSGWSAKVVAWLDVCVDDSTERNQLRVVRVRSLGASPVEASLVGTAWDTSGLRVMTPPVGWSTVLGASDPDGSQVPIVVQKHDTLVFTCPLLGLAVSYHSFPPLTDRYAGVSGRLPSRTFAHLIDLMVEHHMQFGTTALVRINRWPVGFDACLTVRLDYDREISDQSLSELISWIKNAKIGCSFGVLDYLRPSHQLQQLTEAGVEIQMHASGEDERVIRQHLDALRAASDYDVVGATVHGGPSGIGYRGDEHLRHFAAAGIEVAEVIGLESHSPAPIVQPKSNGPQWLASYMAPPLHLSLDGSTRPDDHRQESVVNAAKQRLERGEHAVIMNHPDIHREQLLGTVAAVSRPGVWMASVREVAEWVRSSRFEANSSPDGLISMKPVDQTAQAVVRRPRQPDQRMLIPVSQNLAGFGKSGQSH